MSHNNLKLEGEQYTYEYFFLEDVCRLCWSIEGAIELTSSSSTNNADTIADTILQWLGVDVTTPSHPKKVCMACLNKIQTFAEFKRFCLKSDEKLRHIVQNGSSSQIIHPLKVEINIDSINEESELQMKIESIEVKIEQNLEKQMILKRKILGLNSISDESRDIPAAFLDLPEKKEKSQKLTGEKIKKGSSKIKFPRRTSIHCYTCHLNLQSMENLTDHNLEYHGIEENGMYKCYGCKKRFASYPLRYMHESRHCKELRPGYKCTICDKYLPKRKLFEPHMRAHRENKEIFWPDDIFKCEMCSLSCNSSQSLREHMFVHYKKKKKKYVCEACGHVSNSKGNLDSHKLTHETLKPLKCPHCDYRTKQPSALAVHIRIHTGERPFACDLCPHRSISSSNLTTHRKVHFDGKDFQCNICQKQFRQKDGLTGHIASVHKKTKLRCNQCDVHYSWFKNLREHLLSKHGKIVKKVKDSFIEVGVHKPSKRKKKVVGEK